MIKTINAQINFFIKISARKGEQIAGFDIRKDGIVICRFADGSFTDIWTYCSYVHPSFDVDRFVGWNGRAGQTSYLDMDVCAN